MSKFQTFASYAIAKTIINAKKKKEQEKTAEEKKRTAPKRKNIV